MDPTHRFASRNSFSVEFQKRVVRGDWIGEFDKAVTSRNATNRKVAIYTRKATKTTIQQQDTISEVATFIDFLQM